MISVLVCLLSRFDESRQADSIVKSWGVVEFHYNGWDVKNFDTLSVSDSIPVPDGEYRVIDNYGPLHVRGKWEYYKRDWKTREFKPALGSILRGYPLDLLDWGRYLVFYIRGKGRYKSGATFIYKGMCKGTRIGVFSLDTTWKNLIINLDSVEAKYDVYNPPDVGWHGSLPCSYGNGKPKPFMIYISPLADTFGTYEYEIELSPIYLVR